MLILFVSVCIASLLLLSVVFFFTDTATTEIYTLSLHDALPISVWATRSATARDTAWGWKCTRSRGSRNRRGGCPTLRSNRGRSEEHTSELQSLRHLVCRLLLEKKKKNKKQQKQKNTEDNNLPHK